MKDIQHFVLQIFILISYVTYFNMASMSATHDSVSQSSGPRQRVTKLEWHSLLYKGTIHNF